MNKQIIFAIKISVCSIIIASSISPLAAQVKKATTATKPTTTTAAPIKKTTVAVKPKAPVTNKVTKPVTPAVAKKPVATKNVKPVAATKPTKQSAITTTAPAIKKSSAPTEAELAAVKPSNRENQMVDEINLLRSNPSDYIRYVNDYVKKHKLSQEGKDAADELKEQLINLSTLPLVKLDARMYIEAKRYGKEMLQNNSIDHSDLPYRENILFGTENIREGIIDLLIDDDEPERGHRKNLLNKRISLAAIHELPGKVEGYNYCIIQEFK